MLKAGGTVEEYEANASSTKASLREQLQCFLPACLLTITVEAGSVILTVIATDTAAGASQVESAAVAMRKRPLGEISSVLGVTIEEAPAAPSVVDVQVPVTRLAPSPPPPSPPPPLQPRPSADFFLDFDFTTKEAFITIILPVGLGLILVVLLGLLAIVQRRRQRQCRWQCRRRCRRRCRCPARERRSRDTTVTVRHVSPDEVDITSIAPIRKTISWTDC